MPQNGGASPGPGDEHGRCPAARMAAARRLLGPGQAAWPWQDGRLEDDRSG
jgi:hypothetical protein